ncbi:MAG: sigma-54 dependent transcriptional regulator [candidate division KSB1 bacterium]|nr:sigma-54 dependent transcriptional regulator [candidate division KSB1 bacterium]
MTERLYDLQLSPQEDNYLNDTQNTTGSYTKFELYYPKISRVQQMRDMYQLILKIAQSQASILIHGETGTGKELVAAAIQNKSPRSNKPFIKVNCAALNEHLLESELFGHEKGAFTGALSLRKGKFEKSDGGTLFLDEIGDMALSTQAKILRVLQDQTFNRLGGNLDIRVNVRVIAATNKDLWVQMQSDKFRNDLFYRLNVVSLAMPPLRDRKEDIPLLAEYFRKKFSVELRKKVRPFTRNAMQMLMDHHWPGNIRELRNLLERAILIAKPGKPIASHALNMPGTAYFEAGAHEKRQEERDGTNFKTLNLQELERQAIVTALMRAKWVQRDAAKLLGISPRVLNYKVSQHDIRHEKWRKYHD